MCSFDVGAVGEVGEILKRILPEMGRYSSLQFRKLAYNYALARIRRAIIYRLCQPPPVDVFYIDFRLGGGIAEFSTVGEPWVGLLGTSRFFRDARTSEFAVLGLTRPDGVFCVWRYEPSSLAVLDFECRAAPLCKRLEERRAGHRGLRRAERVRPRSTTTAEDISSEAEHKYF